jgi:hypothetical protein
MRRLREDSMKRENLHEDQEVMIWLSDHRSNHRNYAGKITSIRRALLDIEYTWGASASTTTFVIETQKRHFPKGAYQSGGMTSDRFYTTEQWAEQERQTAALKAFQATGLIERNSMSLTTEQHLAVAAALDPHRIPLAVTLEEAQELLNGLDCMRHLTAHEFLSELRVRLMAQLTRGADAVRDYEQREAENREDR